MIHHAERSDAPVATPDCSARPLLITIAATLLLPMAFLIFAAARFDPGTSAQSTTESTQETTIETAKADSTVPPSVDLVEESVSLEHRRADAGAGMRDESWMESGADSGNPGSGPPNTFGAWRR